MKIATKARLCALNNPHLPASRLWQTRWLAPRARPMTKLAPKTRLLAENIFCGRWHDAWEGLDVVSTCTCTKAGTYALEKTRLAK
ncbi:hypothetical protein KKD84_00830 [Patescibacteria group bacterium]|nr:hypothetical protein [Patescibacteria group bacterium]